MIVGTPVKFVTWRGAVRYGVVERVSPAGHIIREYGGGSFFVQRKRRPAGACVNYGLTRLLG